MEIIHDPLRRHGRDAGLDLLVRCRPGCRRRSRRRSACSPSRPARSTSVRVSWKAGWSRLNRGAPRVPVGGLPAGAAGERRPLGLSPTGAAGAVRAEPVRLDVVLVEAGLVAADAVVVDGQVGDESSRTCRRRCGFQVRSCSVGRVDAGGPAAPARRRRSRWCPSPSARRTACRPGPSTARPGPPGSRRPGCRGSAARSSSGRSTSRSTNWANFARWSVNTSGAVSAMKPAVSLDQ